MEKDEFDFDDFDPAALDAVMTQVEQSSSLFQVTDKQLEQTLSNVWGYEHFREGQLEAIQAICQGKDCAVYWPTGQGKSLCYQLPALAARAMGLAKTALVVSPLISLMQDQVQALKMKTGNDSAACFISSVSEPRIEQRAMAGEFAVVYCTPEGFNLRNIPKRMAAQLLLIAIDEAHCVSEYGHDFRPDYRNIGQLLGNSRSIPLVCLTATAPPRVRSDIEQNLGLKHGFFVASKSVDRVNLHLKCALKTGTNSVSKIVSSLAKKITSSRANSTIVYCATRREVDETLEQLKTCIRQIDHTKEYLAVGYHAGLSQAARSAAHHDFLVSKAKIIVATVAFGMGIDKADIRRVIHIGPPKTFEEYTQQVGRAGRDGKSAQCLMLYSPHEFDKYSREFYLGGLTPAARAAVQLSTARLFAYAQAGISQCRRAMILDYFDEKYENGWRCQTCDLCSHWEQQQGQNKTAPKIIDRDFTPPARRVAIAVQQNSRAGIPMSDLVSLVTSGDIRNDAKKKQRYAASIKILASTPKASLRIDDYKNWLIPGMASRGIIRREHRQKYKHSFTVFVPGNLCAALADGTSQFFMPPPPALLEQELAEKRVLEARIAELESNGIDLKNIPKAELESGNSPILDAEIKWLRTITSWRTSGQNEKADKYNALMEKILAWREQQAQKHRVSPDIVLADHVVKNIAYALPVTISDLKALGVRFAAGVSSLSRLIRAATSELGISSTTQTTDSSPIVPLPKNINYKPSKAWAFAIPSTKKKSWEISYERFQNKNESIGAIAANQNSGNPIRQGTVVGHLLTALTFGHPLDLQRLHNQGKKALPESCGAPTINQITQFDDALAACSDVVDVVGTESYSLPLLARAYGGPVAEAYAIDVKARTEEQQNILNEWHVLRTWWQTFKRIGYDPNECSRPAKRLKPSSKANTVIDLT